MNRVAGDVQFGIGVARAIEANIVDRTVFIRVRRKCQPIQCRRDRGVESDQQDRTIRIVRDSNVSGTAVR